MGNAKRPKGAPVNLTIDVQTSPRRKLVRAFVGKEYCLREESHVGLGRTGSFCFQGHYLPRQILKEPNFEHGGSSSAALWALSFGFSMGSEMDYVREDSELQHIFYSSNFLNG
jgi:hypothetical protein